LQLQLKISYLKINKKFLANQLSLKKTANFLRKIASFISTVFILGIFFFLGKNNYDLHFAWQDPIARWQGISQVMTTDWQAWGNYGLELEKAGYLQQAIGVYLKIYQHNPGDWQTLVKIGDLFLKQDQEAEADHYYLQATRVNPGVKEIKDKRIELRVN
jgi:tetratricopeptide (TPR) repeat protein